MLDIPADTPDAMIYSSKTQKGLQLIRAEWEAPIQVLNNCRTLQLSNNEYVNFNRSLTEEISAIFTRIQVDQDEVHCTANRAASGDRVPRQSTVQ